jgi:hypothetical protein
MAFLGFGQGPRQCIGKPLALMSMKMILAKVGSDIHSLKGPHHNVVYLIISHVFLQALLHFKFEVCDATIDHCKRDPASLFSDPLEPLILQVVPIH